MTVLYHLDSLQKARRPFAGGNYTYRQPLGLCQTDYTTRLVFSRQFIVTRNSSFLPGLYER
jgi:hypothetical protein